MVGIALLTLVPGALGGSESATRELLRALARTGTLPYRVYLPPVAPDGAEGLPAEIVGEYRRATRTVGPARGDDASPPRGRARCERRLAPAAAVHYPLTIRLPPVAAPSAVTLHDLQHLDLPHLFSRAERAFRERSPTTAPPARRQIVIVPSAFVRDRAVERLGLDAEKDCA